jgi:hypothetical protein
MRWESDQDEEASIPSEHSAIKNGIAKIDEDPWAMYGKGIFRGFAP